MSGPVLCALPSVSPRSVAQLPYMGRTVQQPLSYIEIFSRCSSTCISLPPLPRYPEPVLNGKRWGEDNVIFKNTIQNTCSGRSNFDSCHSVPDVEASKYEGYMFQKPMHQDLIALHCSSSSTNRHVHRDPGPELFPTHDPLRKTTDDNCYLLVEATRKALSDYITRLYKTSRYDLNFKDTTEFMRRKADRDQQYNDLCGDSVGMPAYFNHPFPYCWTGGTNKMSRQVDTDKQVELESEKLRVVDETSCDLTNEMENADDDFIETKMDPSGDGKNSKITTDESCTMMPKCNVCDNVKVPSGNLTGNGDCKVGDTFGPWSDRSTLMDDCEPLLMSHIYNFKLPSSHHHAQAENEYASTHNQRHGCKQRYTNNADYIGSYTALRRPKMTNYPENQRDRNKFECRSVDILENPENWQSKSKQNCWTFRDDKNNLRIPCISKVIGYKNKTDAHNKIHIDHPEPMPDLRDFKRYSKRVNFFGYNSSVFR